MIQVKLNFKVKNYKDVNEICEILKKDLDIDVVVLNYKRMGGLFERIFR